MAAGAGVSVQLAQYTLAIANAGLMIGRITPGFLSDYLGRFNIMTAVSSLSGILALAFWLLLACYPSTAGIIVFGFLYGFMSGGFVSLGPPCVVELADGKVGFCLAVALGALTGLPIEGAFWVAKGVWAGLMGLTGVVLLVRVLFTKVARVARGGWGVFKKV